MRLGIGPSISKVAAVMRTFVVAFLKDNLKIFFDFQNTDLEHVGIGCLTNLSLSSQNVEIDGANFRFGSSQDFTIMLWFRNNTGNGSVTLFDNSDGSSIGYKCTIKANGRISNTLKGDGGTANDQDSGGDTTKSLDGNWHHLALVFDRDGSRVQYLDGVEDRSKSISSVGDIDNTFPIHFMNNNQATVGNNGFDGSMKNVCIYKRALTLNEIHNIMYKTYSELKGTELTHLQGWWALESDTTDSTGNQNATRTAGTDQSFNTTIYGNNTPTKPRGVDNSKATLADQIGSGSASFNGVSSEDNINCGASNNIIKSNTTTYVFWIKRTGTTKGYALSGQRAGTNGTLLSVGINWSGASADDDGKITIVHWDGSSLLYNTTSSDVLDLNKWHHVAVVLTGSSQKIYVDGAQILSGSNTFDVASPGIGGVSEPFTIGAFNAGASTNLACNIAQAAVYNEAMTQEKIQEISQKQYSELTTSEKTNLTSWWALDEVFLGSNRIVNPSSANFYENGAIVEDKAGSFTEVLIDNIDTLDNWEVNSNATISINADGNLLATGSGGSGSIRIKSNIVTLDTSSFYVFELEIVGGNDTSANLRIDDEEYGQVKYFNGYYNSTTTSTSTPGQLTGRIKTSSSNTGFYLRLSGIDDTKTTIIKHFKLYKVASGNPGVLL